MCCSMLSVLQRQYLLTCKVSSYCLMALHGSFRSTLSSTYISQCVITWSLTANQQMLSEMGHFREEGPALKQHWVNVTCLLVCRAYGTERSTDQRCDNPDIVCVIGQGRLSRPMICLRSRPAYLRMFSTTIVAMVSEAFKEWFNCKTRMPGTVKYRPTVAYWVQIDGINIATELITRYYLNGTLIQCCFNARPTSATLAQHWTNIK